MTRDDLKTFCTLPIDFEAIGLMEPGLAQEPYFCTPVGAEHVGRIGCDGVHFILLPGDERVFCVDPAMGEPGTYVLPVGEDFRTFLSYVLCCRDANPLSQISWMSRQRFDDLLAEDRAGGWPGWEELQDRKEAALAAVARRFDLASAHPYERVRTLQSAFDPACLTFSPEYYDILGLERP